MDFPELLDIIKANYPGLMRMEAYHIDNKVYLRFSDGERELQFILPDIGPNPTIDQAGAFADQFRRNYEKVLDGTWQGMVV